MTSGYDGQHIPIHNKGYDCDSHGRCDTWDPGTPLDPIFSPGLRYRYWDEAEMELSYALALPEVILITYAICFMTASPLR